MNEEQQTYFEMMVGIAFSTVVIMLVGILIGKFSFVLGALMGGVVAAITLWHLFRSLNKTLNLSAQEAEKYGTTSAIIRLGIMGLAIVIAIVFPKVFHVLGVALGMLTLKFSAYLQPVFHKIITKNKKRKVR